MGGKEPMHSLVEIWTQDESVECSVVRQNVSDKRIDGGEAVETKG